MTEDSADFIRLCNKKQNKKNYNCFVIEYEKQWYTIQAVTENERV